MRNNILFATPSLQVSPLRAAIRKSYLADESLAIGRLMDAARTEPDTRARVEAKARELAMGVRAGRGAGIEVFLREYGLDSEEGVVLLCLAEALVRIPDAATANLLIQDKLATANWEKHLGQSGSLLVNASTWGLMLSGKLVRFDADVTHGPRMLVEKLVARLGEPTVRVALKQAMAILAHQFVIGRTIEEALQRAHAPVLGHYRYSFDMLGEAALTAADAERYLESYLGAIAVLGTQAVAEAGAVYTLFDNPGISVKLSALHPRFEYAQSARLMNELVPRVRSLAEAARESGLSLTLDAEESERLEPLLEVFEVVYRSLRDYEGFGVAVQAYQKRAVSVVEWLIDLGHAGGRRIPLRLVKGAYWDSEIKHAQERGLSGYPVFTRKSATDVSYLACARRMAQAPDVIYPQFATHNAHTVAALLEIMGNAWEFEFQRLHGMGEALYAALAKTNIACRIYAPVGSHEDLLPYLVRRLLENGANTSFLRHAHDDTPIESLVADPVEKLRRAGSGPDPRIPLPVDLYPDRKNSFGVNLCDIEALVPLMRDMETKLALAHRAVPLVAGEVSDGPPRAVCDPADRRRTVGQVIEAGPDAVERALEIAAKAQPDWDAVAAKARAAMLECAADLIERERASLMALLVREGGKCIPDADAEVREAADYCRYYARLARDDLGRPKVLPGPAGEHNELHWRGRGVFACISPWNFPLAIFTGQVAAALASGNSVLAKPARQTPLVAHRAVQLLHQAGIPREVLHFLPGPGARLGTRLLADPRLGGVAITGATDTAQAINRRLAGRCGPIVPLIAETGGINAMIVDSSALPEQAAGDALRSAFNSAGQRCSALRVLFLQEEIAPRVLRLLEGAMAELVVGDPALLATDVGPVIDEAARAALEAHAARMADRGKLLCRAPLAPGTENGSFFAPHAFEIAGMDMLDHEVFGPILHVVRYAGDRLDGVIDAINHSGYGLTLGIHSRIDATVRRIQQRARVGNVYVNRNQIGAVVGVQPFGGEGLSGTGPKAGGPHYLYRYAVERTLTVNAAAVGGNASLLSLGED